MKKLYLKKPSESYREITVMQGEEPIPFRLYRTARRRMILRIHTDATVIVNAPKRVPLAEIEAFVLKRADWIRRHQDQCHPPPLPQRYEDGATFRYLGKLYRLSIERSILNRVMLTEQDVLKLYTTRLEEAHIKQMIEHWYQIQAEIVLHERLGHCLNVAAAAGIAFEGPLRLRKMKSCWGTCTKDRKITLNLHLLGADPACIDYVILHELCHLKELNHGPKFYALLSELLPDWKARRQRLNAISH